MLDHDAVVAVTGATSGIGQATARALVAAGARVVIGGRRRDRLDRLVDELGPDRVIAVTVDVRRPEDSLGLIHAATSGFGRLSAVVLNAGLGFYGGILEQTDEECQSMIDTNVSGTVWGVRAAVPALIAAGGGDVVIVSSVAGIRGGGNEAVYSATKAAQIGLAGCLDRELREQHIRVSTICPAAVNTEFAIGNGRQAGDPWLDDVLQPTDVADAIVACLRQPGHVRTTQWTMWGMSESS